MIRYFLLACLLAFSLVVPAQSNFQPATVILQNKEPLNGQVDYKEWAQNPSSFRFRNETGQETVYTTRDVAAFSVGNFDRFERFVVLSGGAGKIKNLEDAGYGKPKMRRTDTLFLRLAETGSYLNLYSYEDKTRIRYFVKVNASGVLHELVLFQYYNMERQNELVSDNYYLTLLYSLSLAPEAANKKQVKTKLQATHYVASDLKAIIQLMNGEKKKAEETGSRTAIRPFAGIFLQRTTAQYSGQTEFVSGAYNKPYYFPGLSAGLDLYNNYYVGRYRFRLEAGLTYTSQHVHKEEPYDKVWVQISDHAFKQVNFALTPQAVISLYNTQKLKVNLGAGFTINMSAYTKNVYRTESVSPYTRYTYDKDYKLNFIWVNVPLRAGVIIHNKLDIYAKYSFPLSSISSYSFHGVALHVMQAGVNYLF